MVVMLCSWKDNHRPGAKQQQPKAGFTKNVIFRLTAQKLGSAPTPMLASIEHWIPFIFSKAVTKLQSLGATSDTAITVLFTD